MRLRYFESTNFGDALNPFIFNSLLPNFFDNDPSVDFFGIGSILGFNMVTEAKRKVLFSSGFAYGTKPSIDNTYDVFCVRGPLTAKALGIDEKLAIVDGAVLLKFLPSEKIIKEYDYSFMPHWESELKFDWKALCDTLNIQYISPMQDYKTTIKQILKSKVVIAEAMHAAIVADALRVPWIPVKAYQGINDFKWNDWAASLELPYQPIAIPSLFNNTAFVRELCSKKISPLLPQSVYGIGINAYQVYQRSSTQPKALQMLEQIKKGRQYLSKDEILESKANQLREKLEQVKRKYSIDN